MSGKDRRATIKFSEDTGDETKQALKRYRDEEGYGSMEDAVRGLLPPWAFRSPKELEGD